MKFFVLFLAINTISAAPLHILYKGATYQGVLGFIGAMGLSVVTIAYLIKNWERMP